MQVTRPAIIATAVIACLAYVVLGLGYHRAGKACYESRHSLDHEPMVFGGPVGLVVDVVLWPLFQVSEAVWQPGVSCHPVPVGVG